MNENYPPLTLPAPRIEKRRSGTPRLVPLPAQILDSRTAIVGRLKEQIDPISAKLRALTEEERRAVFLKLEHQGTVPLTGTGLKAISEPSETFTLAVPRTDNLDKLSQKLDIFASATARNGIVPHAQLATRLQEVREGEPKDRLSQELYDQYDALIAQNWVICEIEMLSLARGSRQQQEELENYRSALNREFRAGTRGTLFEHERLRGSLRAVIRCTGELFRHLVEDGAWQTRITWFESRPSFETFHETTTNFDVGRLGAISRPPDNAPTVCVIDTGVTAGNAFLSAVVREDLGRSFLTTDPDNPNDGYGHGSGVASLVSYYALNLAENATNEGRVWIASARILNGENRLEDNRLFSALLRDAVAHFSAAGIRIFNLSINDLALGWNQNAKRTMPRRSWVARRIDQLSREYDVVFVVSTGNLLISDVNAYLNDGQRYPAYLLDDHACIHDPGQAALALTVGSIAPSTQIVGPGRSSAIAGRDEASPFTRCGPGVRRETKPEVVDYGGNYLIQDDLRRAGMNPGLSVAVASHQLTPAVTYDVGTSFAAARVSYRLAQVLRDLTELGVAPSAPLLKAFLVNSAQFPLAGELTTAFLEALGSNEQGDWLRVFGYGIPDHHRATDCDPYTSILFYQGRIEPDTIQFFDVPVPAMLEKARRGEKRLTVTLVHSPEVQRWGLEEYFGTVLKWRMFRGDIARDDIIQAMASTAADEAMDGQDNNAEAAPELPNELKFGFGVNLRSRGVVQQDILEWTNHRAEYSASPYTLAIVAHEKWGRANPQSVPFAIVVRLEETTRTAEIYAEVEAALVTIEARVRRDR